MQYVKKKKLLRRANTELLHTLKLHAKIRDRPRLPSIVCIQLMLERETDISPPPDRSPYCNSTRRTKPPKDTDFKFGKKYTTDLKTFFSYS